MGPTGPLRVGVLAYPGCFASEVFGVVDLLTMGSHVTRAGGGPSTPFETVVVSPRRRVTASGGVALGVVPPRDVDVLVVPGFEPAPGKDPALALDALRPEIEAIRAHADRGIAVVSICVGAFLLGEAGLLAGRRATTAWLFAGQLARRYPDADITAQELVVSDGGVTTTAAFSAMYDFVLNLIQHHCGRTAARRTARIALIDDARISQAPYVDDELLPTPGDGFCAQVQRFLDQHLQDRYHLPTLAEHFHVSTRTLLRRYKHETGESPLVHLQRARMRRAQHLLESTDRTVRQIHLEIGYRDHGTFATLFTRHFGVRPTDYRAGFHREQASP
ncbi:helix-turn-helix domain-containing protein [Streptomyces sp. S3(2020)]|uniref:GlxA family transcriptional regulator n=1 Tax=Streptomyces sp. S3(2020) TaxID=2732044 RepID=UPI00148838E8|nr:helix-turn-helix domain-containing protein [Streptomyces sp. S3(2020)]NNN31443.1 helix-turn-helix domain-containing protein [Streptomyces sp. S3(2020)]